VLKESRESIVQLVKFKQGVSKKTIKKASLSTEGEGKIFTCRNLHPATTVWLNPPLEKKRQS